jgi:hypothetical protein
MDTNNAAAATKTELTAALTEALAAYRAALAAGDKLKAAHMDIRCGVIMDALAQAR